MTNATSTGSATPATSSTGSQQASGAPASRAGAPATTLESRHGATTVADTVVSKIAGLAAREISGVYNLGGGAARAFGVLRERIPGGTTNASQGVRVEVGEKQAAVDLDIVVEYGVAIVDLAAAIRLNVVGALERMTGLEVVEVNIAVNDVHLPEEEDPDREPSSPPPHSRVS
ncbi:Asp23/Gls24 family envelope stress response protein [Pseudonocardia xishanensis]